MKSSVSHLPDEERKGQVAIFEEKMRLWYADQEIKDASCSACKDDKAPHQDNPIVLCDGCEGGALHLLCSEFPLVPIPGDDDEVSSS